jgi:hypothetical protein
MKKYTACLNVRLLTACGGDATNTSQATATTGNANRASQSANSNPSLPMQKVGFFSPRGIPDELVGKTGLGVFITESIEQVQRSLNNAKRGNAKAYVDIGPIITTPRDPSNISKLYADRSGLMYTKLFEPLARPKVIRFIDADLMEERVNQIISILKDYPDQVETLFVADEPYLDGIPKAELERVGSYLRRKLQEAGLDHIQLGLIFSSGMFNNSYATMVDREAGEYTKAIDTYYDQASNSPDATEREQAEFVRRNRLTTYDKAGNFTTEGGIPNGYGVVGFDFYISTLLQDAVQFRSLDWLSQNTKEPSCQTFKGKSIRDLRLQLSFFRDGGLDRTDNQAADRALLDQMFDCRMKGLTQQLKAQTAGKSVKLMMISESSNNGLLEFDSTGNKEAQQPALLVEARVLDEVKRALKFYQTYQADLQAGLMFFTFENEFDPTINLNIGGASSMPSVMDEIFRFARTE